MDPYTDSHFTVQSPSAAASTAIMDVNHPAGSAPDAQATNIKRETSDGLDGDTNMADIPESATGPSGAAADTEPRSSQPPAAAMPQTNGSSESKPPASVRATKKKGTATLVKKTSSRKSRGGSRAGKARGGSRAALATKMKMTTTASSFASASSPPLGPGSSEAGSGDEEEEESDHGPYCICRGPDDHRWMISCDVCEDWFHGECVSIDKTIGEALIQRYVCPRCTDDKGINVTRYKKTCSLEGCVNPARIYDENIKGVSAAAGTYSVFCSDKHAEDWWELLVRSLPENGKLKSKNAGLTREKFMGLLGASTVYKSLEDEDPWYIGRKPFGKQYPTSLVMFYGLLRLLLLQTEHVLTVRQRFPLNSGPRSTLLSCSHPRSNLFSAHRPQTAMRSPRKSC